MDFIQACKRYFADKGCEFLGEDREMVFFKDKDGEVFGASDNVIAKNMIKKGYWG